MASRQLSQDNQNILRGMYFRDLIISMAGREISSKLVQAVIGIYLGDNAKTDAISHRLREVSVHFLWVYYACIRPQALTETSYTPLISKIIGKSKCQDGRQTSLKSARLDLSNKPKMEIVH